MVIDLWDQDRYIDRDNKNIWKETSKDILYILALDKW